VTWPSTSPLLFEVTEQLDIRARETIAASASNGFVNVDPSKSWRGVNN
jgi:hypothetical protein